MFVVRDWTRNPSYTMVSNDVKDVRDIVIGITGDEDAQSLYLKGENDADH